MKASNLGTPFKTCVFCYYCYRVSLLRFVVKCTVVKRKSEELISAILAKIGELLYVKNCQLWDLVGNVGKSSCVESVALGASPGDELVEKRDRLLTWVFVVLVLNHAGLHTSSKWLHVTNQRWLHVTTWTSHHKSTLNSRNNSTPAQTSWNETWRHYIKRNKCTRRTGHLP